MKKRLALAAAGLAGAVMIGAAGGCAKMSEPWNDAKISVKDDSPAEVYSFPDGFSNVSSKCDRHGNRVYVIYHGDSPYGAVEVVPADPSCGGRR